MRSEHLRGWLAAAIQEEDLDTENWYRVVDLLHTAFREGRIPEEYTWQFIVLIFKGNCLFRGIIVVGVLWETITGMINSCIGESAQFHNTLHGFQ